MDKHLPSTLERYESHTQAEKYNMDNSQITDLKSKFAKDGYVIIESGLSSHTLDDAIDDLLHYFGPNREVPIHVPFSDHGRIQDAWHISQNVLAIAQSKAVDNTLQQLYNKPAQAFQTLNFHSGTAQPVHSDTIHFNCEPFGAMCGVWTALEDISEDQGPLIFYPGSHKLKEMNYLDLGLKADYSSYPAYLEKIKNLIQEHKFKPKYGLLKKGQSLIWSANLLHGGAPHHKKKLSRHSQVTHYYMGEHNAWRPSLSEQERYYFTPEVVRDVSDEPYQYPLKETEVKKRALPIRAINRLKQRFLKN